MGENTVLDVCDICGSKDLQIIKKPASLRIPFYSKEVTYDKVIVHCADCGEEYDVTSDKERSNAIALAEKTSLEGLIEFVTKKGYSLAHIERALDLPTRTISRWKSGQEPSSAGLTLLRFLRVFPWLINIAENNYDESFSKRTLISAAFDTIEDIKKSVLSSDQANLATQKLVICNVAYSAGFGTVNYLGSANYPTTETESVETFIEEVCK